ncbi:MAG: helix-turn-helix transcriptional regulator [Proteobacteria bacterium]|nr:helix-turn-helix transcriptional regulator [Pseudomonadota bacterium]
MFYRHFVRVQRCFHPHCGHACGEGLWVGGFGHRHGRGFASFGGSFMGGGGMGGRFAAGRKLASGDLQLVLLALLAERPSHGYELIKALEERSGGFYTPSPGMVYPALTWLEEMGYASVTTEGARKLYQVTDAGREYLAQHQDAAEAMLRQLDHIARRMSRVREAFSGLDGEDAGEEGELGKARHDLRRTLRERQGTSTEERARIAAILREAIERIKNRP